MLALKKLCAATGEIVYLSQRNDIRMQYLHIEVGEKTAYPPQRPGATRFLVHTALGWALMTFLDKRGVSSIVRRTNSVLPAPDAIDPSTVVNAIEECREKGAIMSANTIRLGHGVIAAPLAIGHRQFSVGVAAPVERLREHFVEYTENLLAVTSEISTI